MSTSTPAKFKRLHRKHLVLLGGAVILIVIAALFVLAEQLLCVRSPLRTADTLIILGGEGNIRVPAAMALITNRFATFVVLSGKGDCEDNLRLLHQRGIRTNIVVLECDSTSTRENALFTVKLLRERKCQRVIIVTSWFHSRRALSCFRKYAPEIQFISAPAPRTIPFRYERSYIAAEYAKIIYYALRWRVPPWVR